MKIIEYIEKKLEIKYLEISPEMPAREACDLMAHYKVTALLVMEDRNLKGIITETDVISAMNTKYHAEPLIVEEVMNNQIIYAVAENTLEECLLIMTQNKIRNLTIFKNNKPIALIAMDDIVGEILTNKNDTIHLLNSYIGSTRNFNLPVVKVEAWIWNNNRQIVV